MQDLRLLEELLMAFSKPVKDGVIDLDIFFERPQRPKHPLLASLDF